MEANLKKRIFAYLIDLFLIFTVLFLIFLAIPKTKSEQKKLEESDQLITSYIEKKISFKEFYEKYSIVQYQLDTKNPQKNIINLLIIILYFIVFPTFLSGKTFGMILIKIQVVDPYKKQIAVWRLFLRALIIYGLGYLIILFMLQLILPKQQYFTGVSILGIIQILLVITSAFMVKYRNGKRGFEDILSNTKVIENK